MDVAFELVNLSDLAEYIVAAVTFIGKEDELTQGLSFKHRV